MDFENIRGNVFKGIIALIVLIISISAGWDTLMYISLVYLISDIIWTIGEAYPLVNAGFSTLLALAGAITFFVTKNMEHYFWILVWVGYFKSEPLWSQIAIMDQYYDIKEDKIYEFLNHDSSLVAKVIASVIVCVLYGLLGSLGLIFAPLALLPVIVLVYRTFVIYQMYQYVDYY